MHDSVIHQFKDSFKHKTETRLVYNKLRLPGMYKLIKDNSMKGHASRAKKSSGHRPELFFINKKFPVTSFRNQHMLLFFVFRRLFLLLQIYRLF